jgi:hypothetical protein
VSIEISPAPDLYVVEFEFPRPSLGISVVLAATCTLAAKLTAWELFPEYRSSALATRVFHVRYAEIDWETGRVFIVKKKRLAIPLLNPEDFEIPPTRKRRNEDEEDDE